MESTSEATAETIITTTVEPERDAMDRKEELKENLLSQVYGRDEYAKKEFWDDRFKE